MEPAGLGLKGRDMKLYVMAFVVTEENPYAEIGEKGLCKVNKEGDVLNFSFAEDLKDEMEELAEQYNEEFPFAHHFISEVA